MVRMYLPDSSNAELPRRAYLEGGKQLVCPGTTGAELLDELKQKSQASPSMRTSCSRGSRSRWG
jgi:hypothetical protein